MPVLQPIPQPNLALEQQLQQLRELDGVINMAPRAPLEATGLHIRIVRLFDDNPIFSKPKITTIGVMITTVVFASMFMLSFSYPEPKFSYIMIGYWVDIAFEGIIIAMYAYVSPFM